MHKTIHIPEFLSQAEIDSFISGHETFKKLFKENYLETDEPVHLDQFQTSGFWFKHDENLKRSSEFEWDKVHVEYRLPGDIWDMPDGKPEFTEFLKSIRSQFDVEEFHYYVRDIMQSKLENACDKHGQVYWTAFYDICYNFEAHCDGRDIKNKRGPRPNNWESLKRDDWHQEEDFEFTRQGLVHLDVKDVLDGTVIFNQSFPYSMYIDFSKLPEEFPVLKNTKNKIKFAKGDSIERYGAEIKDFTHKPFDEDEYDEIMENCIDESIWPIEAGYGLSLEKVCTFDEPGTMYSWDCQKFHKTRPYVEKEQRRRLTLAFHCGRYI